MTTLSDEVASGDRRRALVALRRLLAERIAAGVRPRDLAALSYRLMKVMKEVDEGTVRRRRAPRRTHEWMTDVPRQRRATSDGSSNFCGVVAVAQEALPARISRADRATELRTTLDQAHGVSVLSAERTDGGVQLRLAAHSVQAAEFAEYLLGGLEPGQAWTERDGMLTLSVVLLDV